jgi:hypothetical protein
MPGGLFALVLAALIVGQRLIGRDAGIVCGFIGPYFFRRGNARGIDGPKCGCDADGDMVTSCGNGHFKQATKFFVLESHQRSLDEGMRGVTPGRASGCALAGMALSAGYFVPLVLAR